tara:strand:+ start:280 stop:645 length:366 start_codon:yes stop_codon:yes gene_type:complete
MVWVNKHDWLVMQEQNKNLTNEVIKLRSEVEKHQDDTGEALIERLTRLAKKAGLDVFGKEYQDLMTRVFMDVGGRQSAVLKAYSHTGFVKDNSEQVMDRVRELQQEASIITKSLENKSSKK